MHAKLPTVLPLRSLHSLHLATRTLMVCIRKWYKFPSCKKPLHFDATQSIINWTSSEWITLFTFYNTQTSKKLWKKYFYRTRKTIWRRKMKNNNKKNANSNFNANQLSVFEEYYLKYNNILHCQPLHLLCKNFFPYIHFCTVKIGTPLAHIRILKYDNQRN